MHISDIVNNNYLVAVQCLTYNHSGFIKDTLNGFVQQNTKFPFVCIVMDDCSTDGEQTVIKEWMQRNLASIKSYDLDLAELYIATHRENANCSLVCYFLKQNLYCDKRKGELLDEWLPYTKYIAICEGDDYWTDPKKLQKQVDILEADETLMACATNVSVVDNHSTLLAPIRPGAVVPDNKTGRYTLRDFFNNNNQYPTLSVVYRNTHVGEIREMMEHMKNPFMSDWTLWIALHTFGDFYFLNEVTGAYRINPNSVTHTVNRVARAKANRDICLKVADVLPKEYADIADDLRHTDWVWVSLVFAYKAEKRYLGMMGALFMSLIKCPKTLYERLGKSILKK